MSDVGHDKYFAERHLPALYFSALGNLCVEFAYMEWQLQQVIWDLLRVTRK
jgi:hypothetical protein